jgi:thiol-disulfide isomerase/thioredoxin
MEEDYTKYIPLILIALLTIMQVFIRFSSKKAKGKSVEWLSDWIDESLLQEPRLLLYFSSEVCQPCKTLAPVIEQLKEKGANIIKLDAIEDGELGTRLGARGAPAFVIINKGIVEDVHLGALTTAKLEKICFG